MNRSTKSQASINKQIPMKKFSKLKDSLRSFKIEIWSLLGIWNLKFGI